MRVRTYSRGISAVRCGNDLFVLAARKHEKGVARGNLFSLRSLDTDHRDIQHTMLCKSPPREDRQ